MKEKYLLMYLNTGGGHRAPARALAACWMRHFAGVVEPIPVDGLQNAPRYARVILEDGYRFLQAEARWIYELLYALLKVPMFASATAYLVSKVVAKSLARTLEHERPAKIVLLHFFLIRPVKDALRMLGLQIPVVVVVTDPFTAHPLWFLDKDLDFIIHSERLKDHCCALGIPPRRLHVFPMILGERFTAQRHDKTGAKVELGFSGDRPVVLLLGGGDGLPRGESILNAILKSDIGTEVAMVCGRNAGLEERAKALAALSPVRVTVFGYTEKIVELINAADVVISKGGASTVMETLLLGKMPLITDYLWEQEKGNVEFVVEHGIGAYENDIGKIPAILDRYLHDSAWQQSVEERIAGLNLTNGTGEICKFIAAQKNGDVSSPLLNIRKE